MESRARVMRGLAAACVAAVLTAGATAVSAAPSFGISGTPVQAGNSLFVTVTGTDLVDLYGYQFTLDYDPTRLRFVTTQEGVFLAQGGTTFFDGGTADPANGTVSLVFDTLVGTVPGVTGSGDLARFEFATLQSGPADFSLSDVEAVDSTLAAIPVETAAASVAIPEPTTGAAMVLGLLAMAGMRSRGARSTIATSRR